MTTPLEKALTANPEVSGVSSDPTGAAGPFSGNSLEFAGGAVELDSRAFRASLVKIMPGYNWTVHRVAKGAKKLTATGAQSSGFNRCSTLEVTWERKSQCDWYVARSSGFGLRAPWLGEVGDVTLARALRGLQDHYQRKAANYDAHMRALKNARVAPTLTNGGPHD